jgi:hypothetical protein
VEARKKSLYFEAASMPASGAWAEKRRLATSLREIVDLLVMSEAPESELAAAADAAAAFDGAVGFAQFLTGSPGMTAGLSVRYRRSTPLRTELGFDAEVDRVEGRKIFTSGRLLVGDLVAAEAVFVSIDANRFAALLAEQDRG